MNQRWALDYTTQWETVPVIDKNTKADIYTQLPIKKPYVALNTIMYINIRQQELVTCKKIGYGFYCKELFVVRHKSRYRYKNAIYFNLDKEIIKQNCEFKFNYNKTDVTLTVHNWGNKIILGNWPDVLVNRSVLCNCGIKAENNFLLESLATCHDADINLVMYFTVNTAFVNYIDQSNLTEKTKISNTN